MTESLGSGHLIHANASMTGGAFEVFEVGVDTGQGPPSHVHLERDEAFYVIAGRFAFWSGVETIEATAGEFVFVPRGSQHRFESRSNGARLLFVVAPAGLEGFFREMHVLLARGTEPMRARVELAGRYDSHPVTDGDQPGRP